MAGKPIFKEKKCLTLLGFKDIHQSDFKNELSDTRLPSLAAIIVYRLPWTWQSSKLVMKFIHAGLNVLAFILAVISLVAVFDFHNAAKIPNMYSLHSWLGLGAVILYCLQVNELLFL